MFYIWNKKKKILLHQKPRVSDDQRREMKRMPMFIILSIVLISLITVAIIYKKIARRDYIYSAVSPVSFKTENTATSETNSSVVDRKANASFLGNNDNPQPIDNSPAKAKTKISWGAYVGQRPADAIYFEQKIGRKMDQQAIFVHWGNENEFPWLLAQPVKEEGKTLIIFWQAMDYNNQSAEQPNFSYDAILKGDWDEYIKSFAKSLKMYGGPVILIPFEEMNSNWYPWSGTVNNNDSDKHIAAYRHIKNLFGNPSNIKFGWCINAESVPDTEANALEKYYPGDAYVDYVGVNGFNDGNPWLTFNQIFGNALERLKAFNKPIYIFSLASAEGTKKADWILNALTIEIRQYPQIKGWSWFNEQKEKDWRVWSDQNSLDAFKSSLP